MQQPLETDQLNQLKISAEQLADRLPALLLQAQRIVQNIAQGNHGRRRAGPGENFWQFRRYEPGEPAHRIDWRRSASGDGLYVREREWESSHIFWLWVDLSPSMFFRSAHAKVSKAERALLIGLAMCELLTQNGEQVGYLGLTKPRPGRNTTSHICESLMSQLRRASFDGHMPIDPAIRKNSELILLSDFMEDLEALHGQLNQISSRETKGTLLQITDPIEEHLPFKGRALFTDSEDQTVYDAANVAHIQKTYYQAFARHRASLHDWANRLGWLFLSHTTDHDALQILSHLHSYICDKVRPNQDVKTSMGDPLAIDPMGETP